MSAPLPESDGPEAAVLRVHLTPPVLSELTRIAMRHGPLTVSHRGRAVVASGPRFTLELDGDGKIVSRTVLSSVRAEDEVDARWRERELVSAPSGELAPLGNGARLAGRCQCALPLGLGDACGVCGRPPVQRVPRPPP